MLFLSKAKTDIAVNADPKLVHIFHLHRQSDLQLYATAHKDHFLFQERFGRKVLLVLIICNRCARRYFLRLLKTFGKTHLVRYNDLPTRVLLGLGKNGYHPRRQAC